MLNKILQTQVFEFLTHFKNGTNAVLSSNVHDEELCHEKSIIITRRNLKWKFHNSERVV